jgi:hypothetical protein
MKDAETMKNDLRKIIVRHTSEMLDNPRADGIYSTTYFYDSLEAELIAYIREYGKPSVFPGRPSSIRKSPKQEIDIKEEK